jgi:hypothetical protein
MMNARNTDLSLSKKACIKNVKFPARCSDNLFPGPLFKVHKRNGQNLNVQFAPLHMSDLIPIVLRQFCYPSTILPAKKAYRLFARPECQDCVHVMANAIRNNLHNIDWLIRKLKISCHAQLGVPHDTQCEDLWLYLAEYLEKQFLIRLEVVPVDELDQ